MIMYVKTDAQTWIFGHFFDFYFSSKTSKITGVLYDFLFFTNGRNETYKLLDVPAKRQILANHKRSILSSFQTWT
jgi:hypothetical protein